MNDVFAPAASLTMTANEALEASIVQMMDSAFTEACGGGNVKAIALTAAAQIGSATAGAYSSNAANPGKQQLSPML